MPRSDRRRGRSRQSLPDRAQPAPRGPYHQEGVKRKERNPARPAATRLCGIYYGIKQKERRSGVEVGKLCSKIMHEQRSLAGMLC